MELVTGVEAVKELGAQGAIIVMAFFLLKALLGRMRSHEERSTAEHTQMITSIKTLTDRPCMYEASKRRND